MLKKIKLFHAEERREKGRFIEYLHTDNTEEVMFNTSLIKFINTLKIDKKTVWKIKLVNSNETLYTVPFKL